MHCSIKTKLEGMQHAYKYDLIYVQVQMGVSKNCGTPKWMVYFMENPIKIPWIWGFFPLFLETPK